MMESLQHHFLERASGRCSCLCNRLNTSCCRSAWTWAWVGRRVSKYGKDSAMFGEIVCVAWKTDIMPAHSFAYGHRACLLEKGPWPNQKIRELAQDDLSPTMACDMCGEVLIFNERSRTTWMPPTDHTTPMVFYNQNHLRVKHTYARIMAAWQVRCWCGWTTNNREVVQCWTEPVRQGRFLVALVTLLERSTGERTIAYFAVQCASDEEHERSVIQT